MMSKKAVMVVAIAIIVTMVVTTRNVCYSIFVK